MRTRRVVKLLRHSTFEPVQRGLAQLIFGQELLLGPAEVMWRQVTAHRVWDDWRQGNEGSCINSTQAKWGEVIAYWRRGASPANVRNHRHRHCRCTVEALRSYQRAANVTRRWACAQVIVLEATRTPRQGVGLCYSISV